MLDKVLCDLAIEFATKYGNNRKVAFYYWNKGDLLHIWNGSVMRGGKEGHTEIMIERSPVTVARLDSFIELHGLPDRWGFSDVGS